MFQGMPPLRVIDEEDAQEETLPKIEESSMDAEHSELPLSRMQSDAPPFEEGEVDGHGEGAALTRMPDCSHAPAEFDHGRCPAAPQFFFDTGGGLFPEHPDVDTGDEPARCSFADHRSETGQGGGPIDLDIETQSIQLEHGNHDRKAVKRDLSHPLT
jgi:hypothetical protein